MDKYELQHQGKPVARYPRQQDAIRRIMFMSGEKNYTMQQALKDGYKIVPLVSLTPEQELSAGIATLERLAYDLKYAEMQDEGYIMSCIADLIDYLKDEVDLKQS